MIGCLAVLNKMFDLGIHFIDIFKNSLNFCCDMSSFIIIAVAVSCADPEHLTWDDPDVKLKTQ